MSRVTYIQFTNPGGYPPLEHSASILAEAGADIRVLGTTANGTNGMAWPARANIVVDIMPKHDHGLAQQVDYLRYAGRVVRELQKHPADWLYVSDALAAPIALLVRGATRSRILYHEHDEPYAPGASRLTRLVQRARSRLARIADEVVVPNAGRAERLRLASGRATPVRVVWNCPRREEVRLNAAPASGSLRLVYQGSITPVRVPFAIIEAMSRMPDVELRIVGYETAGSRGYLEALRTEAGIRGVSDRLTIAGTIPRSEMLETTARCHVGLSFMPLDSPNPNETTMVGSSNKAFEYLACGLGLIVSDTPEWRDIFVAAGVAQSCDPGDVSSLERALRWYVERRHELPGISARGQDLIRDRWNYEAQFAPVAAVLLAGERSAVNPMIGR